MAIATLAALRTAINQSPRLSVHKEPLAFPFDGANFYQTGWGQIWDHWAASGYPGTGVNPSTAAGTQYSSASAGAPLLGTTAGSNYALAELVANASWSPATYPPAGSYPMSSNTEYFVHVWDRVWANGALPLNSAVRQSWVFPALTRYATGAGLSLWFRLYTAVGASNTTMTIEYVNSAGTPTTFAFLLPLNQSVIFNPYSCIPLPLALGDQGIRSISAVTLSPAGSATAASYGFMLAKYLGCYRINSADSLSSTSFLGGLPSFDGAACLSFGLQIGNTASVTAGAGSAGAPGTMPRFGVEARILAL